MGWVLKNTYHPLRHQSISLLGTLEENPLKNTHNPQRHQSTCLLATLMGYSFTETQTTVRRSMGRRKEGVEEGEGREISTENTVQDDRKNVPGGAQKTPVHHFAIKYRVHGRLMSSWCLGKVSFN